MGRPAAKAIAKMSARAKTCNATGRTWNFTSSERSGGTTFSADVSNAGQIRNSNCDATIHRMLEIETLAAIGAFRFGYSAETFSEPWLRRYRQGERNLAFT
jgi:hypothetical protein